MRIDDALTGNETLSIQDMIGFTNGVVFSPDGKRLVSCNSNPIKSDHAGVVKVWDVTTGNQLLALQGHFGMIRDVAVSPDGKLIASASYDRTLRLWDAVSGQQTLSLKVEPGAAFSVILAPMESVSCQSAWTTR